MYYGTSPELTTINETIADLSANEIQQRAFALYYPEYLPKEQEVKDLSTTREEDLGEVVHQDAPPPFDFRAEMHQTRLEVDRLLELGKISDAEAYMEQRRLFFGENGYFLRRLNQAYFAFHGSYAADPGGAAGAEGVDLGAQLRELQSRMPSYKTFLQTVAWRWRLDQFEDLFQDR
jgi:hypothetical protein